ncbi:CaiB/BaiF CoA transferase family protein [Sneathiella chinensis]|uniref:CoA transferase n=1 Tax=Sneathiella chinensis TaxID=349750 RepID=A0ABQ5U176_9PROT|nr:CaiB/BaiF CoA-transferase family protein [Sneathiella chinensis]GLQ05473.1 CoA transferase [Sneathiella chinensis]
MSLKGALKGLKVVDLSRVLGGPFCTQILADHGAEVIKVEPPQGDETRTWGPPFNEEGLSAYFSGANRNKRSIALDIRTPEGKEILLKLLRDADILVENFKTGSMEKWGLGYEDVLSREFPRLIHCRVTGFGADGPFGGFPGYDAVIQAWAGLISVNGSPDSGPVRVGIPLVDLGTGMNAVIGILLAVNERHVSGKGQSVEASLYDTGIQLQHPHAANTLMSGNAPRLTGNSHPNIAPYDLYQTATAPIFLGIGNNGQFRKLCAELGRSDMADDPRFGDNASRLQHRDELNALINEALHDKDGIEFATRLLDAGVPAGAAMSVPEALEHPHTRHREMVVEMDGYRGTGVAVKMSRTPGAVVSPPPAFGADGRDILSDVGYSPDEVERLLEDGILWEQPKS